MMKQIMKRAWEIYRELEGDKIAKLSMALRQAWAEYKETGIKVVTKILRAYVAQHLANASALLESQIAKGVKITKSKFGFISAIAGNIDAEIIGSNNELKVNIWYCGNPIEEAA